MDPATSKLLELASAPFLPSGTRFELDDLDPLGRNGMVIKEILTKKMASFVSSKRLDFFRLRTRKLPGGFMSGTLTLFGKKNTVGSLMEYFVLQKTYSEINSAYRTKMYVFLI